MKSVLIGSAIVLFILGLALGCAIGELAWQLGLVQ
jgi:hypothetical protein